MIKNVLITGHPGSGKTTLLKKIIARFGHLALTGFYTEEIREEGRRVGFKVVTLSGQSAIFAHKDFHAGPERRVGRYGVKPQVLDALVLRHLNAARKSADLVVIDEIAKMELFSSAFKEALVQVLDSLFPVLATISIKGSGLIKKIKERDDVALFTVTPKNRDVLGEQIQRQMNEIFSASAPRSRKAIPSV